MEQQNHVHTASQMYHRMSLNNKSATSQQQAAWVQWNNNGMRKGMANNEPAVNNSVSSPTAVMSRRRTSPQSRVTVTSYRNGKYRVVHRYSVTLVTPATVIGKRGPQTEQASAASAEPQQRQTAITV